MQSHPGTWNQAQTIFSRKEVARSVEGYRLNIIIVQARRCHHHWRCQHPEEKRDPVPMPLHWGQSAPEIEAPSGSG